LKRKILWLLPILLISLLIFTACDENNTTGSNEDSSDEQDSPHNLDYDEEAVLVTVNGDEITQGHYDTYIIQLKTLYKAQHGIDLDDPQHGDIASELQVRAMNDLIEQRALVQRSKELNLSVPSSSVDNQVQGIIEQQGSQEAFETFLEDRNLTREGLEILIEEDSLISKLYDEELSLEEITYEEEELTALYDRYVEQREEMGREPEPFEEVEEDLKQSLIQRLRHEKQQDYIENLIDGSDIEYFFN